MPTPDNSNLKLVKSQNLVADRNASALADIYKALKSITFYPEVHPQRNESLRQAHGGLQHLLNGREIVLVVGRAGFSTAGGGAPVGSNTKAQGLARELFVRRVQRLTILADVSSDDLLAFLKLLTIEPRKVQESGGMEELMHRCAIRCVWVNEVDLSVIQQKRRELEDDSSVPSSSDDVIPELVHLESPVEIPLPEEIPFDELLSLLDAETMDNRYLQLAKRVVSQSDALMEAGDFEQAMAAVDLLLRHSEDASRSELQRECATFTFEQVAGGAMSDYLLDQLQNSENEDNEQIHLIFQKLGAKIVYAIIQRICLVEGLLARKALADALIRVGEPAIFPMIYMLRDERWYVVRNMVAMLGEIGSRACVGEMQSVAFHKDSRVRKEAIRSLSKIGGSSAENTIIKLLDDQDQGIVRQAIVSLGIIRCQAAVEPLLRLLLQRDRFLRDLAVKKDVAQALGLIGDRTVTPYLLAILNSFHLFARRSWLELKIAVVNALGHIGDESALPALRRGAMKRGSLGAACNDAIDSIERLSRVSR